jgi:small-conductance mechanosensitive channel
LTQEQFDSLVGAIGDAVVRRLTATGTGPAAAPPLKAEPVSPSPAEAMLPPIDDALSRVITTVKRQGREILGAVPGWPAEFGAAMANLRAASNGTEWPALPFVVLLGIVVLAALATERAVRAALARPRRYVQQMPQGPFRQICLVLLDAVGVVALIVVALAASALLFHDGGLQEKLAGFARGVLITWRVMLFASEVVLRPAAAEGRLVPFDDTLARQIHSMLSLFLVVLLPILLFTRVLRDGGMPDVEIRLYMAVGGLIGAAALFHAIARLRRALDPWTAARTSLGPVARLFATRWSYFAYALAAALLLAWESGVLMHSPHAFTALIRSMITVVAFIVLDAVTGYVGRMLFGATDAASGSPRTAAGLFHRCIRIGLWIVAAVLIAEIWLVGAIEQSLWAGGGRSIATAGVTLFVAFVAWEIVKFAIDRHLVQDASPLAGMEQGDGAEESKLSPRELRLRTMLPLLRIALAGIILVLALLIALSELGVNTAPLIAGASVFGLAISFGSQSLVRDVVSGIFFMADDAFRVGEYIDTGRAKGTVEGMSLRSIRLRHQNGPVATIPFGQILSVTNFSRDWSTVKFNLRLARDTDIEKVRKMVKKLGQELLQDPEIGRDFLLPLKLQGMADVADNALICRLKFTVKPVRPTYVQRQALKRIFNLFLEQGVKFASNQVTVQTADGSPLPAAALPTMAGAAANQPAARSGAAGA